jgi:hypothetical protein
VLDGTSVTGTCTLPTNIDKTNQPLVLQQLSVVRVHTSTVCPLVVCRLVCYCILYPVSSSENRVMGSVAEMPPAKRKKNKAPTYGTSVPTNGIMLANPGTYLTRDELVTKTVKFARSSGFVAVVSPPATGKTSLLVLLKNQVRKSTPTALVYALRPTQVPVDLYDLVKQKTGVDFRNEQFTDGKEPPNKATEIWIMIDDCQKLYGETYNDFWENVVKNRANSEFQEAWSFRVIVAATYYLDTAESPVSFGSELRIRHNDLRIDKEDADDLFSKLSDRPNWGDFNKKLQDMSNGHIGVFTQGISFLNEILMDADNRQGEEMTESKALSDLCEQIGFVERLKRCFQGDLTRDDHNQVATRVVDAYRAGLTTPSVEAGIEPGPVGRLQKAGVLTNNGAFTCPAASLFYYSKIFPRCAKTRPSSLEILVLEAAKSLSSARLVAGCDTIDGRRQFPKEAVFQQIFHEAIAGQLPAHHTVLPEMNTCVVINGKRVLGELDFYINGGLEWALELVRSGDQISDHIACMETGKYRDVVAKEWLVLDCKHGLHEPTKKHKNRCTMAFSPDYKTCNWFMGHEAPITISFLDLSSVANMYIL